MNRHKVKDILKEIVAGIIFALMIFAFFIGVLYLRGIPAYASTKKYTKIETSAIKAEPKFPECETLNAVMDPELQRFIWELCKARFPEGGEELNQYYASMIGLAEGESTFRAKAYNDKNKNGTVDRGLYQINSCHIKELKQIGLISSSEDLYDPYTAAVCGDYQWWQCYSLSGWDMSSYSRYLYGINKPNKDNKYTQRVWNMQQNWYNTIFGG